MFCALSAGYLIDKESTMLAKQFGLGSLGLVPLMFMNSQDDTNYKAKMWKMQHLIHLPLTALTLLKAFKKERRRRTSLRRRGAREARPPLSGRQPHTPSIREGRTDAPCVIGTVGVH